ncbi:NAD(P)-dependent dehydrogenase (short-subunit alcohol dehydrogenase family) [Pedobacter sp. CG_S7]|uniref:SDR family NAD(P)-dependent oxidoreductase n=1 Tax=Pedobacter sp. CG_S7 TaxID=3143930 RepID=UPI003391C12D
MDLQLKGKTAFISGSTQGIGFAIAKQLLQEGSIVIINGRKKEGVDIAIEKLRQQVPDAKISGIAADFGKVNEVNELLAQLPDVDILINNAGIFEPKTFEDISDEDWFRFFEINVLSGIRLSRFLFPKMLANNWGRIIFITSESAINIPEEMIHYGMTKTALHAVGRGLAELTKGSAVTVNMIMPGPTGSEGMVEFIKQLADAKDITAEQAEEDFFKTVRPSSLIQRFANVAEVANLVTYVSSPLASATNGSSLRVDGGIVKTIL